MVTYRERRLKPPSFVIKLFNYNYSNSKGKTKAGDTFNSSLNMGPSDMRYTSNLVDGEEVTAGDDGKVILNWTPVKVSTFSITDSTGKIGLADAFGNITFAGDDTAKAIVTPAGVITGLAKDTYKVTYKFDNESVREDGHEQAGFSNVPAAELQIKSIPVNAETRTMRAYNTQCAA